MGKREIYVTYVTIEQYRTKMKEILQAVPKGNKKKAAEAFNKLERLYLRIRPKPTRNEDKDLRRYLLKISPPFIKKTLKELEELEKLCLALQKLCRAVLLRN